MVFDEFTKGSHHVISSLASPKEGVDEKGGCW